MYHVCLVTSVQLTSGRVDTKMVTGEIKFTISCCVESIMKSATIDAFNMAQYLRRTNIILIHSHIHMHTKQT